MLMTDLNLCAWCISKSLSWSIEAGCFCSLSPWWSHVGHVVRQLSSRQMLGSSTFIGTPGNGIGNFMSYETVDLMEVSAQGLKENKLLWVNEICLALNTSVSLALKRKPESFSHRT